MIELAASILSANFACLGAEAQAAVARSITVGIVAHVTNALDHEQNPGMYRPKNEEALHAAGHQTRIGLTGETYDEGTEKETR